MTASPCPETFRWAFLTILRIRVFGELTCDTCQAIAVHGSVRLYHDVLARLTCCCFNTRNLSEAMIPAKRT